MHYYELLYMSSEALYLLHYQQFSSMLLEIQYLSIPTGAIVLPDGL